MIKERIQTEINKRINQEFYSAYIYLSMNAYFLSTNLNGFANWMKIQAQEELAHAMKLLDYLNERGGKVELETIEKPQIDWESPLDAFEAAYKHEQYISGRIDELVDQAIAEHDHATNIFLQWYVTEQVEEEDSARAVVEELRFIGDDKRAILMLDRELGQRVFMPPVEGNK